MNIIQLVKSIPDELTKLVNTETHLTRKPKLAGYAGQAEFDAALKQWESNTVKCSVGLDFAGVTDDELKQLASDSAWILAQRAIRSDFDSYRSATHLIVDVRELLDKAPDRTPSVEKATAKIVKTASSEQLADIIRTLQSQLKTMQSK